jgi:hypothetical protein
MPKEGLEPTPTCVDRILNPARLPFRHFGAVDHSNFRHSQDIPGAPTEQEFNLVEAELARVPVMAEVWRLPLLDLSNCHTECSQA